MLRVQVPVLVDGDLEITESPVVAEYVLRTYGGSLGARPAGRRRGAACCVRLHACLSGTGSFQGGAADNVPHAFPACPSACPQTSCQPTLGPWPRRSCGRSCLAQTSAPHRQAGAVRFGFTMVVAWPRGSRRAGWAVNYISGCTELTGGSFPLHWALLPLLALPYALVCRAGGHPEVRHQG